MDIHATVAHKVAKTGRRMESDMGMTRWGQCTQNPKPLFSAAMVYDGQEKVGKVACGQLHWEVPLRKQRAKSVHGCG